MWMPDGKSIYFMSDRVGAQNIWSLALGSKLKQITKFTDGRVLWPSMSYDGKAVVFERDFKVWKLDTKTGEAFQLPLKLVGMAAGPGTTHLTLTTFNDLALSPVAVAFAKHEHLISPYVHTYAEQLFRFVHFYADYYSTVTASV